MRENWKRVSDLSIASEGGYTNDRRDPGNWTGGKVGKGELKGTKYGIAANTYGHMDIPNLTRAQAVAIYKRDYWDKVSGDRLPSGVDYCAFDYALNSGVDRAGRDLQRVAGITPVDGNVGTGTVDELLTKNAADVITAYCAARLKFMKGLKVWPTYGKGWTTRVNKVRSVSLAMAKGRVGSSAKAMPDFESAKARPDNVTATSALTSDGEGQAKTVTAASTGLSGLAEVGQTLTDTSSQLETMSYYLDIAKYLFLACALAGITITIYLTIKRKRQEI